MTHAKRCSFCAKDEVEVNKLIFGPGGVAICDACIDISYGALSEEGVTSPPSPADKEVLEAIPHRPPFLFVDRILECTASKIRTERTIRACEPQFRGHYPGMPLMPGVLLCEALIQSGAILIARSMVGGPGDGVPVLTRMGEAKFKKMVKPGDIVEMEAELIEQLSNAFYLKGRASAGGQKVLTLEFACTLASNRGSGEAVPRSESSAPGSGVPPRP